MFTASDEAIDLLLDRIDAESEDFGPFREEWLIEMRQFVRSWLAEHVVYRDITVPQLRTKHPIQKAE